MIVAQSGDPERERDVTFQFRAVAAAQMREPRKPVPPQTTSFLGAVEVAILAIIKKDFWPICDLCKITCGKFLTVKLRKWDKIVTTMISRYPKHSRIAQSSEQLWLSQ